MFKKWVVLIVFSVLFIPISNAQTSGAEGRAMMKGILEQWCENHFESCFNWKFVGIEYISEVLPLPGDKYIVKGVNRNSAIGGGSINDVVTREFKAIIENVGENKFQVKFKKQVIYQLLGESWDTCTRTVEF